MLAGQSHRVCPLPPPVRTYGGALRPVGIPPYTEVAHCGVVLRLGMISPLPLTDALHCVYCTAVNCDPGVIPPAIDVCIYIWIWICTCARTCICICNCTWISICTCVSQPPHKMQPLLALSVTPSLHGARCLGRALPDPVESFTECDGTAA